MRERAATTAAADVPVLRACAEDAAVLARLHDRELGAEELAALAAAPARDWLWLALPGEDAAAGFRLIDQWLAARPAGGDAATDELAADFADIYLTFGKRVSPTESYWLTEDHLERQEPMFEVRRWLEHYGLTAADWRRRTDDHLVTELQFIAHLLAEGSRESLGDAAHFLDQHLLRWSRAFCAGTAQGAATGFYAGLALVTEAWLQAMRDELAAASGVARQVIAEPERPPEQAEAPAAYVPGSGPGW